MSTVDASARDEAARHTIRTALEANVMVLAGAGAGKTYEMIERMAALVRAGKPVDRIAAITFTRKAAGEMQARFFERLHRLRTETGPEEAAVIAAALERIDRCTIDTIHAFCGRLLRERPVEAGLPPDFTELDARDEQRLRAEAWRSYLAAAPEAARARLREHGLRPSDWLRFFGDLCTFADLRLHRPDAPRPDLRPAVDRVRAFTTDALPHVPPAPVDPNGYDGVQQTLLLARRFFEHHGVHTPGDAAWIVGRFHGLEHKITLKRWGERPSDAYAFAQSLKREILPTLSEELAPALRAWEAYAYTLAADFCLPAVAHYERLRLDTGRLTFQDLLVRARNLLRDHPAVRRQFQERYLYLFVDEFQDTDPIQAEILFYLTDTARPDEPDWTRLAPDPGRLFLVGDGKQSIYRFRRADYATFSLVRERVSDAGHVVELQRSFRSKEVLCGWFNTAFPPIFEPHGPPHQAPFRALLPAGHLSDPEPHPRVRRLTVEYVRGLKSADVAAVEADRIARFIAAVARPDGALRARYTRAPGILPDDVGYGDFMILARTTKRLHLYAAALERYGIPYDRSGGGGLGASTGLALLLSVLDAVGDPDDPVALLTYLCGPLVGCSDADLYAFHRAGGTFAYPSVVPNVLDPDVAARFDGAFARLRRVEALLHEQPPAAALAAMLNELGVLVEWSFGEGGSSHAGGMLKLLELARGLEARGAHWTDVHTEFRELAEDPAYTVEEMTLETGATDAAGRPAAVRVMNLHKAKGLEAGVVFLADPEGAVSERVDVHVARAGEAEPYVVLPVMSAGDFGGPPRPILRPLDWEMFEEAERAFLQAEETRLLYVAATRAKYLLVVSGALGRDGALRPGAWGAFHPATPDAPELEDPPPPEPLAPTPAPDPQAVRAHRTALRARQAAPSHPNADPVRAPRDAVLGRLLAAVLEAGLDTVSARRHLYRLLIEADLDPADAHSDVWGRYGRFLRSPLYARFDTAEIRYAAVPTTLPDGREGTIDAAFREPDGWTLVVFADPSDAAHRAWANACAEAWREAGEPVANVVVWDATAPNPNVPAPSRNDAIH